MSDTPKIAFAPQLVIKNGVRDVDFYIKGFGAVELRRFSNDDGSIHVSALPIQGAIFHLHEETSIATHFNPEKHNGITTLIGIFDADVDKRCVWSPVDD